MSWLGKLFGRRGRDASPAGASPPPDDPAPAVTARLREVYDDQMPFCYGAAVSFADGGDDPLERVEIYWHREGPHWHYVGFGTEDTGTVLTFRLAARPEDEGREPARFLGAIAYQAPTWPIGMLNMLARRIRRTGRVFGEGHWWQGPPGVLRPHAEFEHLAFARDPELGVIETPRGPLRFLCALAVTPEVIAAMQADERDGRGDATLDGLAADNPLRVTRVPAPPPRGGRWAGP